MAWRSERWADIVARAASAKHSAPPVAERERPEALAARAETWTFPRARVAIESEGLLLGDGMESVSVAFAQLYHVEPVDPWPSLAIGWVDRAEPYKCVLTPLDDETDAFGAAAERVVDTCEERVPRATARGWLAVPEEAWEPIDALPGERDRGPDMRGYRMAPGDIDPIVARRTIGAGAPRLWTYVWARFRRPGRRIEPYEVIVTREFVNVRTRGGVRARMPLASLRTARRTPAGDAIYVFGRNTELLLVAQDDCPVQTYLDAQAGIA